MHEDIPSLERERYTMPIFHRLRQCFCTRQVSDFAAPNIFVGSQAMYSLKVSADFFVRSLA